MDDDYQQSCSARSKGKCRAVPYDDVRFGEASEQSPLLVNDSLVRDDTPPRSRLRNLFYRRYDEENEQESSEVVLRRRKLPLLLAGVFLATLLLTAFGLVILSFLGRAASVMMKKILENQELQEKLSKDALVVAGPLRLDFINVTAAGAEEGVVVWLNIEAKAGIDGGKVVNNVLDALYDHEKNRNGGTVQWEPQFVRRWKESIGRWSVKQIGHVSISTSDIYLYDGSTEQPDEEHDRPLLLNFRVPPLVLPLSSEAPSNSSSLDSDPSWLSTYSLPIRVSVTQNVSDIAEFFFESWKTGTANVQVNLPQLFVNAGDQNDKTWRGWLKVEANDFNVHLKPIVPAIPGLPKPGSGDPLPPLNSLVTLQSFTVTSNQANHKVEIRANATTINPLPRHRLLGDSFNVEVPSLDFVISLPNNTSPEGDDALEGESVVVAIGKTDAFVVHPPNDLLPNVTISMKAKIPTLPESSTPLISTALSHYLSAEPIPILINSPLIPSLNIPFLFPAPPERPKLLQDVVIRDVRVGIKGETVLASGEVVVRAVLPGEGKIRVAVDARRVWPDVLVFDGEVPEEGEEGGDEGDTLDGEVTFPTIPLPIPFPTPKLPLPHPEIPIPLPKFPNHHDEPDRPAIPSDHSKIPKPPLPTPLPPRAFARIRPEDWLEAHSVPLPDETDPFPKDDEAGQPPAYQYLVTSRFTDIPLEVLPGRESLLRKFVTKVVFGGEGAVAGVKGVAGVAASVDGVVLGGDDGGEEGGGGSEVELLGIPVQGSFRVGKKAL